MRILVTAGNTQTPIDRVRCLTNIFTGRTGTNLALHCLNKGHEVTLMTSHPQLLNENHNTNPTTNTNLRVLPYSTFKDLEESLCEHFTTEKMDAVIHCAAVSDYECAGVFSPSVDTCFDASNNRWQTSTAESPSFIDMSAGKVKSDARELWLRLVRTPKLVDMMRGAWNFQGVLVKFKLEVDVTTETLLERAEKSRLQSSADLMVANTLEEAAICAYVGPLNGVYERVERHEIGGVLLREIEKISAVKIND